MELISISMELIIGFLIAAAQSEAQDALRKVMKSFIKTDQHRDDKVFKKTLQALKKAYDSFFKQYGEHFGPREKSFLAWEVNVNLMLNRIRMDKGKLEPLDFITTGEEDYPKPTDKELQFLIDAYEMTLKEDRELSDLLYLSENLSAKPQPDDSKVPQLLTPLPPKKAIFIGRQQELSDLDQKLGKSGHVLLVHGLGGIGKTEVCKQFFHTRYHQYRHAAWLDYTGSIAESMARVFRFDQNNWFGILAGDTPDKVLDKVLLFFRSKNSDSGGLLILDNIDNPGDPDLDRLLSLPCAVMVNSRNIIRGFTPYTLDFLDEEGCRDLFYTYYKGAKNDETAGKIIHLCHYHTLTVELLARTGQNASLTIKELHGHLTEKGFNLNEVIKDKVHTFWNNEKDRKLFFEHLLTIFALSGEESPTQLHLLTNLAVLPPEFIPARTIREFLKLETGEVLEQLVSKGWLRQEGQDIFMHHVIQEVTRFRQETQPNAERCRTLIDSLIWKLKMEPGENPLSRSEYMHFAESVLVHIPESDQDIATLANNLSMIYWPLGQLEKALEVQLKAIKIREETLNPQHPNLATAYNNLSLIYKYLGQLEKALEVQLKAIKIIEVVLDPQHPDLATSYSNLSLIYNDLGQLEKALEVQLKAIKIREEILEPQHPDLATSYNNLSMIHQNLGQSGKALDAQLKTIKIREEILEPQHPDLVISYNNLSIIYEGLGQLEKALEVQLKTVAIFEQILEPQHPNRAQSYNNLSLIYRNLGQLKKALEFQLKTVAIFEQIFDPKHPSLVTSYNNLSMIYLGLGQLEKALEVQLKTVTISEEIFSPRHPTIATSYNNLSAIYRELGKFKKAIEFQLKSNKIVEDILEPQHPSLAASYNNLSMIYQNLGQLGKALRYAKKAVSILRELFPDGHPNLDIVVQNLQGLKSAIRSKKR